MANEEHYKLLRRGWRVWNEWRKLNPGIRPELSRIRLWDDTFYNLDLSGANLIGSDLSRSGFIGTSFHQANLRRVNFGGSILSEVNLSGANLKYALLTHTDLSRANLSNTNLTLANLSYAKLNGANLESATLAMTIFGNTELIDVTGLDTCLHTYPSVIDPLTLAISGDLPLNFLRGCGLSDTFITFIPSLRNEPIQFYSSFLSYSSKDQDFAERLHADLQNNGVRVWFAPHDMRIGAHIRRAIDESIRVYDKLLLVLSGASVNSQWVEQEVETALAKERQSGHDVLFPVRLDDTVMEMKGGWPTLIKNTRHIGDFTQWKNFNSYQRSFERLMHDLKRNRVPE